MGNELPRAFLFGAGGTGQNLLPLVKKEYQVAGFVDNDPNLGKGGVLGLPVYPPEALTREEYDAVIVTSYQGMQPITRQLLGMGIDGRKIVTKYVQIQAEARILFLERAGRLIRENSVEGCCAEGGVFEGAFAREINRVFPDRKLYLFDTFEGFDARDVTVEAAKGFSDAEANAGYLSKSCENRVLEALPFSERAVIRKGFFPETAAGLEAETFCFVNLDFDLYVPIFAGLEFFVPRMSKGGYILVHDYFSDRYKGVKQAVADFRTDRMPLNLFPIGDGISIGIGFW